MAIENSQTIRLGQITAYQVVGGSEAMISVATVRGAVVAKALPRMGPRPMNLTLRCQKQTGLVLLAHF